MSIGFIFGMVVGFFTGAFTVYSMFAGWGAFRALSKPSSLRSSQNHIQQPAIPLLRPSSKTH